MAGALLAAASVAETRVLNTTITIGTGGGAQGYVAGSFGSLGDDTFVDGNGTTRTITQIAQNGDPLLVFILDGASIPDDDNTWKTIRVGDGANAKVLSRASAAYDPNVSGDTSWSWMGVDAIDGSGTDPLEILL